MQRSQCGSHGSIDSAALLSTELRARAISEDAALQGPKRYSVPQAQLPKHVLGSGKMCSCWNASHSIAHKGLHAKGPEYDNK